MPNSMLQPSPISTTLAFSSRVVWFCSVALILSISALVMTVAVVGFPGLGWARTARGIRTAAVSKTFSAVFFMVFLLNILSPLRRCWSGSLRQCPDGHLDQDVRFAPRTRQCYTRAGRLPPKYLTTTVQALNPRVIDPFRGGIDRNRL